MVITSADPYRLQALIARERGRRAIIVRGGITEVERGLWAVEVTKLRPLARPWVKPVAVLGALSAVGVAGWWLLQVAVAALATISIAGLVGAVALFALLAGLGRRGSGCETTVIVRHRH